MVSNSHYFSLTIYTNSYWDRKLDDRKITRGGVVFLGNHWVIQLNKNLSCIFLSIAETEYIVATTNCTYILLMKQTYDKTIPIICDNTSAIRIFKKILFFIKKTKHIPPKVPFSYRKVGWWDRNLEYVSTKEQVVVILTKSLTR